jgi:hypothetical protein
MRIMNTYVCILLKKQIDTTAIQKAKRNRRHNRITFTIDIECFVFLWFDILHVMKEKPSSCIHVPVPFILHKVYLHTVDSTYRSKPPLKHAFIVYKLTCLFFADFYTDTFDRKHTSSECPNHSSV